MHPKGGRGCLMSPPCLKSQCCQFDPNFLKLYLLFVFFFCLILLLFLSDPFLPLAHTPDFFSHNLHFPKGMPCCVALVLLLLLFSGREMNILVGGMCSICCHTTLALAFMHLYSIFNLRLFLSIIFIFVLIWYWNARPKRSMVPVSPNCICHLFTIESKTEGINFRIVFIFLRL